MQVTKPMPGSREARLKTKARKIVRLSKQAEVSKQVAKRRRQYYKRAGLKIREAATTPEMASLISKWGQFVVTAGKAYDEVVLKRPELADEQFLPQLCEYIAANKGITQTFDELTSVLQETLAAPKILRDTERALIQRAQARVARHAG